MNLLNNILFIFQPNKKKQMNANINDSGKWERLLMEPNSPIATVEPIVR